MLVEFHCHFFIISWLVSLQFWGRIWQIISFRATQVGLRISCILVLLSVLRGLQLSLVPSPWWTLGFLFRKRWLRCTVQENKSEGETDFDFLLLSRYGAVGKSCPFSSVYKQNSLVGVTEMRSERPSRDRAVGSAGGCSHQLPWDGLRCGQPPWPRTCPS